MKINIGDYKIESDSNNFILKTKKVLQEGRLTKEENIGKEVYSTIGYYTSLEGVLKVIPKQVLLENDDLGVIIKKLNVIKIQIEGIRKALEV